MHARLKNYRQAPRKVRLVTDLIKGKAVSRALVVLDTTPKRATGQLKKMVLSAVANAKQKENIIIENLIIKEIRVDKGVSMHRFLPRAHGRASRIDKHTSNVWLLLEERVQKSKITQKSDTPENKKAHKKNTK